MQNKENEIIALLKKEAELSSKDIFDALAISLSYASVKRLLVKLVEGNIVGKKGKGKSTKYFLSNFFELLYPVDMDKYYEKDIDERKIKEHYNFELIPALFNIDNIFTNKELAQLNILQDRYSANITQLSQFEYKKELERLAIDLSWKSSQIEGNTYSLLETEILLKEKKTASGRTKEEAIMLLNHKDAIDFIVEYPDFILPLSLNKIEDIHSLLIKELGIERNIRKRRVGISGTNYKPLDNEFQITEAMTQLCKLVNARKNVFEKAFITLLFISYIQPFVDGNKRTARIISNAVLLGNNYCPISFRTVDSVEYKKAVLVFYEQNNISCFKKIFIEQFDFAVNTYF